MSKKKKTTDKIDLDATVGQPEGTHAESFQFGNDHNTIFDVAGRYELKNEIARGGMGAIVIGHDNILSRDLAIKVLLDSHSDNPEILKRFLEEAQINSQLQHPGIVPVHEVGELKDKRPFFAMKLVKGKTLKELFAERADKPEERTRFLGVFEQVCQTIAYAHSRNVIHRDLKPANIMVGAFGEVQVMDWGLAKVINVEDAKVEEKRKSVPDDERSIIRTIRSHESSIPNQVDSSHTRMGSVMGTPAYMPSEQALGEIDRVDERADVFSLGAILCEILTGSAPYVADDTNAIIRMASRGKLADARERLDNCNADPDVVALAKECLGVEPEDRPRNASVLVERLTAHFESVDKRLHQAKVDRATADEERKRQKVLGALAASLLAMMVMIGCGWMWFQSQQTELANTRAKAAEDEVTRQQEFAKVETRLRKEALDAKTKTELTLSEVYASRGLLAAESGNPGAAVLWFAEAANQATSVPERIEDNHLRARNWTRNVTSLVAMRKLDFQHSDISFQPCGDLLLIQDTFPDFFQGGRGRNYFCQIWDWKKDRALNWMDGSEKINLARWANDGEFLAISPVSGGVRLQRTSDGKVIRELDHPGKIWALQFSHDDHYLAIASDVVRIWDTQAEEFLDVAWRQDSVVHSLSFNGTNDLLAVSLENDLTRIFAPADKSYGVFEFYHECYHFDDEGQTRTYTSPAWIKGEGNEELVLSITGVDEISSWDVRTKLLKQKFEAGGITRLSRIESFGEGKKFAASGYYGPYIWDSVDPYNPKVKLEHTNLVENFQLSNDGAMLLSGSWDSSVQLCDTITGESITERILLTEAVYRVQLSDDEKYIAMSDIGGKIRIFRRPEKPVIHRLQELAFGRIWKPTFSQDGKLCTVAKADGSLFGQGGKKAFDINVFDTATFQPVCPPIRPRGFVVDTAFTCDNKNIAMVSIEGELGWLQSWNVKTGVATGKPIRLEGLPSNIASNPKRLEFSIILRNGTVTTIDSKTAEEKYRYTVVRDTTAAEHRLMVRYTPDGKMLAVRGGEHRIHVLDSKTGKLKYPTTKKPEHESYDIDFSSDSQFMVTIRGNKAIIFSLEDGSQVGKTLLHPTVRSDMTVVRAQFSPDGNFVLTASLDKRARVWDWRTGKQVCPEMVHDNEVFSAVFSPDGKYVITGSKGKFFGPHYWEVRTGKMIGPSAISEFPKTSDGMYTLAIDERRHLFGFCSGATDQADSFFAIDVSKLLSTPEWSVEDYRIFGEISTAKTIQGGDTRGLTYEEVSTRWREHQKRRAPATGAR